MKTESVLTDVEIGVCICRVYDKSNAREIGELRLSSHIVPIGRAIEQAVLQSPEVQALRKDAERYRWLRSVPDAVMARRTVNDTPEGMDAAIDAAMEKQ